MAGPLFQALITGGSAGAVIGAANLCFNIWKHQTDRRLAVDRELPHAQLVAEPSLTPGLFRLQIRFLPDGPKGSWEIGIRPPSGLTARFSPSKPTPPGELVAALPDLIELSTGQATTVWWKPTRTSEFGRKTVRATVWFRRPQQERPYKRRVPVRFQNLNNPH